jgi:hypothetical protein
MKDLSDRFAQGDDAAKAAARPDPMAAARPDPMAAARPDPLTRLQQAAPDDQTANERPVRHWFAALSGRADLLAAAGAALAAALVLWPLLHPAVVHLPAIADTGDEVATLTVRPLVENGVAAPPDWAGLFNAYQLETALRDISIRCNYALPADARVDRYLHARLTAGTAIHVFLADPGTCPKL